ncbi:MAG: ATP-binding protein, partial [Myxococcota bacterium]|nr:ATP-binding protein [Myxococcota bacterium]
MSEKLKRIFVIHHKINERSRIWPLLHAGYNIQSCLFSDNHLNLAELFQPDLVLLIDNNPTKQLTNISQWFRSKLGSFTTKFAVLTSELTPAQHKVLLDHGANFCLTESMDDVDITSHLRNQLLLKETEDKLLRTQEELLNSRLKSHLVVDGMVDSVAIIDTEGRIRTVNNALKKTLGYQLDELIGKPIEALLGEEELLRMTGVLEALKEGPITNLNISMLAKNGHSPPMTISVSPVSETDNQVRSYIFVGHDSLQLMEAFSESTRLAAAQQEKTERLTSIYEELKLAKHKVEEADRTKTQFVANISHEIRTPMTSILGYADLLTDPSLKDDDQQHSIHAIRRNAQHLLTIINDLLDITKLEAGKMTVEIVPCSPFKLLLDVKSVISHRAKEKGLAFLIDFKGPIPLSIKSDPTRVQQILVNLAGNSIKFTQTGEIRITVAMVPNPQGGSDLLSFEIEDTGIGMAPKQTERVFERFEQADASTTRRFGGTGLGLAISSQLITLLGGTIAVRSQPGLGSKFTANISVGNTENIEMVDNPHEHLEHSAIRAKNAPSAPPPVGGRVRRA